MNKDQLDFFITNNSHNLPQDCLESLYKNLSLANDLQWERIRSIKLKDSSIALVLSIVIGVFGADRFYIGDYSLGVGKLGLTLTLYVWAFYSGFVNQNPHSVIITLGLLIELAICVWYISDIFVVRRKLKRNNFNQLKLVLE